MLLAWAAVRNAGRAPVPRWSGPRRSAVRRAGWGAVAALLVAVVANLIGNVSLAEMLTGGVLDSGYVGLALYAGATVLASIVALLLARKA